MHQTAKQRNVSRRALRILIVTNAMILVAGAMLAPIYALFVEEVGGQLIDASIAVGIFALTAGVTTLVAGYYSDKIKEEELVVVAGYLVAGLGFLGLAFVDSLRMLFAVQAIIGIAEAVYWPAFDKLYSKHVTARSAGRQWGMWEATSYFTTAAGAFVGGTIAAIFGFTTMFFLMAALAFASGIYIFSLPRKAL